MKNQTQYKAALRSLDALLPKIQKCVEEAGKLVCRMLNNDREACFSDLAQRGLPKRTVERLERVGAGTALPELFQWGTFGAGLVELLPIEDQRTVVYKGVDVVTGGPDNAPTVRTLKFSEMSTRNLRMVVDKDRRRLRTVKEMIAARRVRSSISSKVVPMPCVLKGTKIVFNQREWEIDELDTALRILTGGRAKALKRAA